MKPLATIDSAPGDHRLSRKGWYTGIVLSRHRILQLLYESAPPDDETQV